MKKTNILFLIALIAMVALTSCAHSNNTEVTIKAGEHIYGFWGGTWHGIISGFSFIGSLFDNSIRVYAVNNNGHWYDFGFIGAFFFMLKIIRVIFKGLSSN